MYNSTALPAQYGKHAAYVVHQDEPFNGGSPADHLRQAYLTPTDAFYVRAHAPVPDVDPAAYRLTVNGLVQQALSLSLDDLKREFTEHTLTVTLQCAGNRRQELHEVQPVPGSSVMWDKEAISTATWTGVSLADVLARAGLDAAAAHVEFVSLDQVEQDGAVFGYGGSIPLAKAQSGEVLLVYLMNGEPLSPVHGAPLRVIVPGYVAARSVKWVSQINLRAEPSDNFYQQHDYKVFPPEVTEANADWSQGEMLGELRTDAVICQPQPGAILPTGDVVIQGYAVPGGEAIITRVEISTDDGATWTDAVLHAEGADQRWAWRFWEARVTLAVGTHPLRARAHDSTGYVQPLRPADIWNFRGYMNNSVHRVTVEVSSGSHR